VAFTLPANLVDSVHSDRSARRDAWLDALPRLVAAYAGRWSLDLEPPYQPGGRSAWVAAARDRAGRDVVLKVAWQHDEAPHEEYAFLPVKIILRTRRGGGGGRRRRPTSPHLCDRQEQIGRDRLPGTIAGPDPAEITKRLSTQGRRRVAEEIGDVSVTFSGNGTADNSDRAAVRLDLAGDLHGAAVAQLRLRLLESIIAERSDDLIIDLDAVTCLSPAALATLIVGCVTAIDYGTSYRVINAHDNVRRVIEASGTADLLADSDDIGALLLALAVGASGIGSG
jgi:anti-anti-sigma factor